MSYAQTMNQLAELKLNTMLKTYQQMEKDTTWLNMTFDDQFAHIVNQEYETRINNRVYRAIKEAKFKDRAELHDIIYNKDRNLNRDLIQRFATHRWIQNHENIIITGATGTGKSYLAQALGVHACRHGYKAQYYRLPDLLNELRFSKQNDSYLRIKNKIKRRDILILDDWGLATLDLLSGHEIAEIIEDRLGITSTIVVSQFPIGNWDTIFQDKTTADAVMDRLIHVAYLIELEGPSLRKNAASKELLDYKESMLK